VAVAVGTAITEAMVWMELHKMHTTMAVEAEVVDFLEVVDMFQELQHIERIHFCWEGKEDSLILET
jgi:hypothetical protein